MPDGNSLQEIRKFLGRDSKKRLGRNWLYQSQFRLDLSRKIIRIFLRIAAYPVFFAVMALELPIDCTRIPIRHLFPGGMPFPAGDRIGTEDILVIVCGSAVLRSDSLFFLKRERIEPQILLF